MGTLVLVEVPAEVEAVDDAGVETVDDSELEERAVLAEVAVDSVALGWVEEEETGLVGGDVVTTDVDNCEDWVDTSPDVEDCGPTPLPIRKASISRTNSVAIAPDERRSPLFIK